MNEKSTVELSLQKIASMDGGILIRPEGELNTYNAASFGSQVRKVFQEGCYRLIFDLAEVPYIASTPAGMYPDFLKEAKKRGGDIAMANLQPRVMEVFGLLGFKSYLNIVNTLEDALILMAPASSAVNPFPRIFTCAVCGRRLRASKAGFFRCCECKTILRVDGAGSARPVDSLMENDYELVPEKTEKAIRLLGELSRMVRASAFDVAEKTAFKKTLGQIVVNLYQREVKDVWAELEEVRR